MARSVIVPVYCHSRLSGNDLSKPLDSSAFVPDTALPPASMQAGLRRVATGILGGLFPTPLYRLRPVGVPARRIQDFLGGSFSTCLRQAGADTAGHSHPNLQTPTSIAILRPMQFQTATFDTHALF